MALDQALFEHAAKTGVANARFYTWEQPARTVGYFHEFGPTDDNAIRRFTGGGVVEHGKDLTFVLNLPKSTEMTSALYRWIHESIVGALSQTGFEARLENQQRFSAGGDCFAQPVTSDILGGDGKKIGGGAQRRSRGSVIHQGSIRLPSRLRDPHSPWIDKFLESIAKQEKKISDPEKSILDKEANRLVENRYETDQWNRR